MTLASMVRYYREHEPCNQVIPPTIKAVSRVECRCGKCLCCRLAKFVARLERIISKRDFHINNK